MELNDKITELLDLSISQSLTKTNLQAKCQEFQEALRALYEKKPIKPDDISLENIVSRLSTLEQKDELKSNELTSLKKENSSLKKRVKHLEEDLDFAEGRFIDVEKAVHGVEQYTRRENFEISGIPSGVPDDQLKASVIKIVNTITDRSDDRPETSPITEKDIHACHRLKEENGEASVIVRMVNRENTISVLKAKKKLPDMSEGLGFQKKLYINENLCNNNRLLYEEARKLKKNGHITSCWTFNGIVHVRLRETDTRGKRILHFSDFENHFTSTQLGW